LCIGVGAFHVATNSLLVARRWQLSVSC
jgi:hypothetical protein